MHASRLQKELIARATRDVSSRRVRACELVAMPLAEVDTPSLHSQEQRREASKVTLLRRLQRLVCSALAAGAVPRHVAFIMDGNRRYATAARVDRAQGHAHGFEKVRLVGLHATVPAGCLQACLLHVTVTTTASSLTRTPAALAAAGRPGMVLRPGRECCHRVRVQHRELQGAREQSSCRLPWVDSHAAGLSCNHQRSPDEVASLMALARVKLGELERRLLEPVDSSPGRVWPRIRVLGDLQLLPPEVRVAAARVMTASRLGDESGVPHAVGQRPRPVVNLCVAYTGREDLAQAAQRCGEGVAQGWLQPGDVDEVRPPRQPVLGLVCHPF